MAGNIGQFCRHGMPPEPAFEIAGKPQRVPEQSGRGGFAVHRERQSMPDQVAAFDGRLQKFPFTGIGPFECLMNQPGPHRPPEAERAAAFAEMVGRGNRLPQKIPEITAFDAGRIIGETDIQMSFKNDLFQ